MGPGVGRGVGAGAGAVVEIGVAVAAGVGAGIVEATSTGTSVGFTGIDIDVGRAPLAGFPGEAVSRALGVEIASSVAGMASIEASVATGTRVGSLGFLGAEVADVEAGRGIASSLAVSCTAAAETVARSDSVACAHAVIRIRANARRVRLIVCLRQFWILK